MPNLPNWSLSHQSRARITELLKSAGELGLDPDAVSAGGLAAFQALIALKGAKDAGEGFGRAQLIARVQDAIRGLDPAAHGDLLGQFQASLLALQGRGGDTEVAHVTPGEIVLPKTLQTPEVLAALREAAAEAGIRLDRLQVGSGMNAVNPRTARPEFADLSQADIEEIAISAPREIGFVPLPPSAGDEGFYHYDPPEKHFGRAPLMALMGEVGTKWKGMGYAPFGVGEMSLSDGSPYAPHSPTGAHTTGLGVDIRPIRMDGAQVDTNYKKATYDREATQKLVDTLRSTGGVTQILFNDPEIKGVTEYPGHDNHLHVVVDPRYRRLPRR